MKAFSADYLYCNSKLVIPNGIIVIDDSGKIREILNHNEQSKYLDKDSIFFLKGILAPGFVNTHCHLELSTYREAVPPGCTIDGFIRALEKAKKTTNIDLNASFKADEEMWNEGIVAIADISNSANTIEVKSCSKIQYHTFVEVFGSNSEYAEKIFNKGKLIKEQFLNHNLFATITPHSLYACSENLTTLIQKNSQRSLSIHFMESTEENDFFKQRKGAIIERAEAFGVKAEQYKNDRKPPSEIATIAIDQNQKTLFVHNTMSSQEDFELLTTFFRDGWFCLCPLSNLYIEKRLPNIDLLNNMSNNITIGTDSLASNHRLSILEELKTIASHFPKIPTETLLKWGTENGAKFMGIEASYGTLEIGKTPGLNHIHSNGFNLSTATKVTKKA